MSFIGIGPGEWIVIAMNLLVLLFWPGLALLALFALRRQGLTGTALALWVLIIVAVPFLGALAGLIIRPSAVPPPHA
jgi:hypothetical protein